MVDLIPLERILQRHRADQTDLISILAELQQEYRYLPHVCISRVAKHVGLRAADVESIASFYSEFRFSPTGKHSVKVCFGTACYVKGAELIYEAFKAELKIENGSDTDRDRLFTVEKVACLGCCMLAPAVQIGESIYAHVKRDSVPDVLGEFLASLNNADAPRSLGAHRVPIGEIRMCTCTSCVAAGANQVYAEIGRRVEQNGAHVLVKPSGCTGVSYRAPIVEVYDGIHLVARYGNVGAGIGTDIVDAHFPNVSAMARVRTAAQEIAEYLIHGDAAKSPEQYAVSFRDSVDGAYWNPQVRIATAGHEQSDPLDLVEYRGAGGFAAFSAALADAEGVLQSIENSGLRGKGGGGYLTGKKWRSVAEASSHYAGKQATKYVVCNADEGDPGAFMDRMLLESFPFRIVEGAMIAAAVVGADEVYFYVRHEYPLAIERISKAIYKITADSELSVYPLPEFHIIPGAGAFVCGEETALLSAIEGGRGNPRQRPPYPSAEGLYGRPTLVNNVETLATIPWVVIHGAPKFRNLGTAESPGTKTFALAGRIVRGGLVEVPMGISIRHIVEQIGGGVGEGRTAKAVQIGGPSGGCLPESMFDLPIDFDSLANAGAMMGSGGMVVLDNTDCMVSVARYFMSFTQNESCGKCGPCRIGTKRMMEILDRLCTGASRDGDLEELERTGRSVKSLSFCNLGKSAPNPVLTALHYFPDEFHAHANGNCPAGVCREIITYHITDACIGCTRCATSCPVSVISGEPYSKHEITPEHCIRCGTCKNVCPVDAVEVI